MPLIITRKLGPMSPFSKQGINPFNKIILSTFEGYIPIRPEDIIYCKACDSYTHIYMNGGVHHVVSKKLKDYDELLSPHNFFRIHRSFLINANHIEKVSKQEGLTVIMTDGTCLPVSSRRKEVLVSLLR